MNFLEKALRRLWFSCSGACHTHGEGGSACPLLDAAHLRQSEMDPAARRFSQGGALVAAAAAVFLLPLATAVGGAYLTGRYASSILSRDWAQLLGLLAGLAIGVGIARSLLLRARNVGHGGPTLHSTRAETLRGGDA